LKAVTSFFCRTPGLSKRSKHSCRLGLIFH